MKKSNGHEDSYLYHIPLVKEDIICPPQKLEVFNTGLNKDDTWIKDEPKMRGLEESLQQSKIDAMLHPVNKDTMENQRQYHLAMEKLKRIKKSTKSFYIKTVGTDNFFKYLRKGEIIKSSGNQYLKVLKYCDYTNWRIFLSYLGFNMHFEHVKVKPVNGLGIYQQLQSKVGKI